MIGVHSDREGTASGVADWRDRICSTFVDLDCEDIETSGFFGSVTSRHSNELQFSRVHSTKQRVVRSGTRIARSGADDFLLSLQIHGRGSVRQANREAFQRPGDMVLYDTSRPYELIFDGDFRQLILTLPRSLLLRSLPRAEDMTAIGGLRPAARLAASYLATLARQCTEIDPVSRRVANATVFDMLAISFGTGHGQRQSGSGGDLLFRRAIAFIDDYLVDPDLNPAKVAEAIGVSPRYLNLIFARHDISVSRTIWQHRLKRAAGDLINPALMGTSITSIAFSIGFNDTAHFTRAFKAAYGETPSGYRARGAS